MDFENGSECYGQCRPPPFTFRCGNCNIRMETDIQANSIIRIQNISSFELMDVQIWDAVAYLYYGTSGEEYQKYVQKNVDDLETTAEMNVLNTTQTIRLCSSCASLLTENYKAHLQFERVTRSMSVIQQVKNSRHKIFRMSNITPSDLNLNTFESDCPTLLSNHEKEKENFNYTDSDADSINIKCEPHENEDLDDKDWECEGETDHLGPSSMSPYNRELIVKIEQLSADELKQHGAKSSLRQKCLKKTVKTSNEKEEQRKTGPSRKPAHVNVKLSNEFQNVANRLSPVYKRQVKVRFAKKKGKYVCPICNKLFKDQFYLRREHMPTHTNAKQHSCLICHKNFGSKSILRNHKQIHVDGGVKKGCELCGKLLHPKSLLLHMRIHGNRESHTCAQCGKSYLHRHQYDEHVLTHDKDFVPFLCRHCGQTFRSQKILLVHEKIHSEEKKYVCDKCPARFYNRANLNIHQTTHSTEKPFVCEQCGNAYKTPAHLKRHLKIHRDVAERGEYSFTCELCDKICKNSLSLAHHKRKYHGKKKYECCFCGKRVLTQSRLDKHENLHKVNPNYVPRKPKTSRNDPKILPQT